MKNIKLIVSVISVIVIFALMLGWLAFQNDYEPVFLGENGKQLSIEKYLASRGIGYKRDEKSGVILVPEEMVSSVRADLINKGLVKSEAQGYELFADNDYGMTEFSQRVNFQRALQGELEKSIIALNGIRDARVHLILGRTRTLFDSTNAKKASVLIVRESGFRLSSYSIEGIKKLVSGAVEGLSEDSVSVIDSSGSQMGINSGYITEYGDRAASKQIEKNISRRIEGLLKGILRPDEYEFVVSVELFENEQTTEEESIPDKDRGAILKKTRRENKGNGKPTKKSLPELESVEYVYDKTYKKTIRRAGTIKKISIALLIDNQVSLDSVNKIKDIVKIGAGLSDDRGDEIAIRKIKMLTAAKEQYQSEKENNIEGTLANKTKKSKHSLSEFHIYLLLLAGFTIFCSGIAYHLGKRVSKKETKDIAIEFRELLEE